MSQVCVQLHILRDWKQFIQAITLLTFSSKVRSSGVNRLGQCWIEIFAKSLATEDFLSCRSQTSIEVFTWCEIELVCTVLPAIQ